MEGSVGSANETTSASALARTRRLIPAFAAAAIAAILLAKLLLAWRINVNWDEFLFLTRVHELARGELILLFQGAYANLFQWLVDDGDEIRQVVEARIVMWLLLALSAWILLRALRAWVSLPAAAAALFAFLGAWPVLRHGASFRADAMLLPCVLASLALLARAGESRRRDALLAGACFGVACAVTLKAVLSLPFLLLVASLPDARLGRPAARGLAQPFGRWVAFLLTTALVAALLIAVHATQIPAGAGSAVAYAGHAAGATLLEAPLAPRGEQFLDLVREDFAFWIAAAAGLAVALRRRAFAAAATALAVLPVLLYRNAFAYYYPVMMAPLTVLVALSFDGLLQGSARRDRAWMGPLALVLICLVVGVRAWDGLMTLRFDGQAGQRALVAGVHQVFPQPVPYLDHSGMIASFPKLNFFMSTWGVEDYLRGGTDFMPAALEARCPPLLLANHPVLRDGTLLNRQLRANDRRLLATYYVDYWGPIRLAGAELELEPGAVVTARVPCSGRYRIESEADLTIDGAAHRNSDVVELTGSRDIAVSAAGRQRMRLRWADAQVPPAGAPPQLPLYAPL